MFPSCHNIPAEQFCWQLSIFVRPGRPLLRDGCQHAEIGAENLYAIRGFRTATQLSASHLLYASGHPFHSPEEGELVRKIWTNRGVIQLILRVGIGSVPRVEALHEGSSNFRAGPEDEFRDVLRQGAAATPSTEQKAKYVAVERHSQAALSSPQPGSDAERLSQNSIGPTG